MLWMRGSEHLNVKIKKFSVVNWVYVLHEEKWELALFPDLTDFQSHCNKTWTYR